MLKEFGLTTKKLAEDYDEDSVWAFVCDKNSTLVWVNKTCFNIFGLADEEITDVNLLELLQKYNSNHPAMEIFKELISEGKDETLSKEKKIVFLTTPLFEKFKVHQ